MPDVIPVRSKAGRILKPHKAILSAQFDARTVLTESPWEFVSLWLKREHQFGALILWNQAREFHDVSVGLSLQSAPLPLYYSFMNAAKSLLTSKGISFNPHHGIRAEDLRGRSRRIKLSNEGVKIKQDGVLPALSSYLKEIETVRQHTLKELLFNLAYMHRTYCLTYRSQRDMFVPLKDPKFVVNTHTKAAYFSASVSEDFPLTRIRTRLPSTLVLDPSAGPRAIRSAAEATLSNVNSVTSADLAKIALLNLQLRCDLHYINATETLWYAKLNVNGPRRLARFPLTVTLAAMHRLSEICRYRPLELAAFMSSQENWLLTEFVRSAPGQFLDAIASEVTGYQFLLPNVRPAK